MRDDNQLPQVNTQILAALLERLFPADETFAGAVDMGAPLYVERALAGVDRAQSELYRLGLYALDQAARKQFDGPFAACAPTAQDHLIQLLEEGVLPGLDETVQAAFFALLRQHLQEGLFSDPVYGGNRERLGWRFLGHPGVWLENSAQEMLQSTPVTKGGALQSMADYGYDRTASLIHPEPVPGYGPLRGAQPPAGPADVVLAGCGAVGGLIVQRLAQAGLRVVALEAGPWRTKDDFVPDELGVAFYTRANMGPKFLAETPRWRTSEDRPTQEATFSLGRMVNGVGGSTLHYGGWLRRYHPHDFRYRTYITERWGEQALPDQCTLADWPVGYGELEPYYDQLEAEIGIAGDDSNPFLPRRRPFPMPPLQPFRMGELFRTAAQELGLHPYPVPVGVNSQPYAGRPATTYTGWGTGFVSHDDTRWHPGQQAVPAALATGNLDLRTGCRVIRVVTDRQGQATGVDYVDAAGVQRFQAARTVILCSYTFENVRLLLVSGDERHPNGLGNDRGQVGRHFMTKTFAHVDGDFPHIVFNRHAGSSSQGIIVDDFLADSFDALAHGFVGGATLGTENQFLPIQISREALPPEVPTWGAGYKAHLRRWQHWGVVRIQPGTLPYAKNYLDLDPVHRDRSGLGLPVVRITYAMQPNEHRLAAWMEEKAEEILSTMGAARTWRGPRFTGVGSSHDLGGCRMGEDPATSVVDVDLQVHDTPGLYVFGGAAFPSCPGSNPTLTIWALCLHATEKLIERLRHG